MFVGDVSADRQAVYHAAMEDVVTYYADRYGVQAPAFALFIGTDVEAVRAVYRELGAARPETFGSGGRVARLRGGTDAMFLAGSFVSGDGPAHKLLMAHEYFHVLQRHLSEFAPGPPPWLVEGSAHYTALLYISDEGIRPYDVDRRNVISFAAGLDIPFRDLDHDLAHWREQLGEVYNAGVLASEWLINEVGTSAYIDFWRLLATETTWQAAFSAAFGISVDEFHDAFEEHTTDLFADLQRIEGVVLGPDGEPLNGVGVEAWHGGRVGSGTAETRAQGAFAVRVWDGTYHLHIYPDRSALTRFAGWLKAGGGLTAECDEAAIVAVEGADVTGIVIRLPAGWDENLPTLASTQWACVALPKVRGAVLGPDGAPAERIGLWLWGGSNDNSKFAGNAPDGTFDLAHQNGTFVLRVYVWRDAAWDHIGWYGGDTSFTTDLAQATRIEVDDANVTGIEIRLPADPADLPTIE